MKRSYSYAFGNGLPYNGKKRKTYRPGDEAELIVPSTQSGQKAYVKYKVPSSSPAFYNRILKSIPGEAKGMDTDISTVGVITTTNTNANILVLNLVQQGNGSWNRIGRKTHLSSVRLKGAVAFVTAPVVASGVTQAPSCRLTLVWDRQPSSSTIPTFDTIFGITDQNGTESCPDVTCPLKYDNMDRFVVLKDMYMTAPSNPLTSTGTAPQTSVNVGLDVFVKLNGLESVYSGQSAPMTIADISTGALYLVMRSQLIGSSSVNVDGIARLRYKD